MPGLKTNEVPGTRAVLRHYRMSAYKARQVLDLIRGRDADRAEEILTRDATRGRPGGSQGAGFGGGQRPQQRTARPRRALRVGLLCRRGHHAQAVAPTGPGRATRIRKRTCHITVIVSRLPEDRLERRRARQDALTTGLRSRRVAASRRGEERRGGERDGVGTDALSSRRSAPRRSAPRRKARSSTTHRPTSSRTTVTKTTGKAPRSTPRSSSSTTTRSVVRSRCQMKPGKRPRSRSRSKQRSLPRQSLGARAAPARARRRPPKTPMRATPAERAKRRRADPWARRSIPTGSASA